jgi:hypothetical protein
VNAELGLAERPVMPANCEAKGVVQVAVVFDMLKLLSAAFVRASSFVGEALAMVGFRNVEDDEHDDADDGVDADDELAWLDASCRGGVGERRSVDNDVEEHDADADSDDGD